MNISGTNASATGHKGGLGDGLYDKAGARPDLDLDFAKTKSLKDRVSKEDLITFTRSSGTGYGATYVDENGLVKRSPVNFIFHSEDLSTGTYGVFNLGGAISANAGTSPSGNSSYAHIGQGTAGRHTFKIFPAALNANHKIANNTRFVMSLFVKRLSGDSIERYVNLETAAYSTWSHTGYSGVFDLETGTRVTDPSNSNITSGIEDVGDGWYRIHFSVTTGTTSVNTGFYLNKTNVNSSAGSSPSLTLTSSQGHLIWGVQVEEGSVPTTYIPTSGQRSGAPRFTHDPETYESKGLLVESAVTNFLRSSRAISGDTTATQNWVGYASKIAYDNSITNPDGSTGAAYLDDSGSEIYQFFNTSGFNSGAGTDTITISCFVKARSGIIGDFLIELFSQQDGVPDPDHNNNLGIVLRFNPLANNGDGEINSGVTADNASRTITNSKIEKYPNGWFRISCTIFVKPYTYEGTTYSKFLDKSRFDVQGAGHITNNNGKHYFWGAQVEIGSVLTSFIPTLGSTVFRSPDLTSIEGDNFGTYRTNLVKNTSFRKASDGYETTGSFANCTYESYAALSPIGTYDAVKMTATGSSSVQHRIQQYVGDLAVPGSTTDFYSITCYLKKGTADRAYFSLYDGATKGSIKVDLNNGNIIGSVGTNFSVTDVGNGWWKLKVTSLQIVQSIANSSVLVHILEPTATNEFTYVASGQSLFIWGLQVELADAPTEFIPSTDTYTNRQSNATFVDGNGIIRTSYANHLKYSEQLDQATWAKSGGSSITANNVVAPDGTTTADTWSLDSARYGFYNNTANSWMSAHSQLLYPFTITDEWVRYSIPFTTESGQTSMRVYPLRTNNNVAYIYQTNITVIPNTNYVFSAWYKKVGTKVYVWGCQLVRGTVAGDYYKTTDTISGPPRYSHDPETLTPTGLYLEPAATNIVPYSEDFTQSDWDEENATVTANVTTAPDGTNTAHLLAANTNTSVHRLKEVNNSIGPHQYTFSVFVKANGTSHVGLTIYKGGATNNTILSVRFKLNAERVFAVTGTGTLTKYPNGWYRITGTSVPDSITANSGWSIRLFENEDNSNGTFTGTGQSAYIWGAQLEQNTSATSYIPTSGATATRAADNFTSTATKVLDRANGTKPAFYTKNGLTAFVRGTNQPNPPTYAFRFFEFNGGRNLSSADLSLTAHDAGTKIGIFQATDTNIAEPQGISVGLSSPNPTLGLDNKIAVRYETDNLRVNLNGVEGPLVDSSVASGIDTRSSTRVCIGANGGTSGVGTSRILNGTIKRLTFWKTPLSDNKLDKLTS